MTKKQIAANAVRLMHDTHIAYQRQMLAADKVVGMPSAECRGCVVRGIPQQTWLPEWSSHLRPNFWKAYFDTLSHLAK